MVGCAVLQCMVGCGTAVLQRSAVYSAWLVVVVAVVGAGAVVGTGASGDCDKHLYEFQLHKYINI